MALTAYSYVRFSSEIQSRGDSLRRQTAMASSYAAKHGLVLDKTLNFKDIGVSAFRGKNQRNGAMGAFLRAIDLGIVEAGSYLLVESFDRLSREQILPAQSLFLQIVQAGITLVTLIDDRRFSADGINANPYELLISLVSMMRANEESTHKSMRLSQAWVAKRAKALSNPLTSRCPAWLHLNPATRKFEINEERAQIVRRIFSAALNGDGQALIAKRLNRDRTPLLSGAMLSDSHWQSGMVVRILRSPAVFGTLVPHKVRYVDGVRRYHALEPIANYYPAVVTLEDYAHAQALNKGRKRNFDPTLNPHGNIFAWLARCPVCHGSMKVIVSTEPHWRYLICSRAFMDAGCVYRCVRYPELEEAFVDEIEALITSCPKSRKAYVGGKTRARALDTHVDILRTTRADLVRTSSRQRSKSLPLQQLKRLNSELGRAAKQRSGIDTSRDSVALVTLELRLQELESAARTFDIDRPRLNRALRVLFDAIEIDYLRGAVRLQWQHGGRTIVKLHRDVFAIASPRMEHGARVRGRVTGPSTT